MAIARSVLTIPRPCAGITVSYALCNGAGIACCAHGAAAVVAVSGGGGGGGEWLWWCMVVVAVECGGW
jgi:hypothetical protein